MPGLPRIPPSDASRLAPGPSFRTAASPRHRPPETQRAAPEEKKSRRSNRRGFLFPFSTFDPEHLLLLGPQHGERLLKPIHAEAVREVPGQDGVDDLRGEQRQPQHPGHVGPVLPDGVCQLADVGEMPFVDQRLSGRFFSSQPLNGSKKRVSKNVSANGVHISLIGNAGPMHLTSCNSTDFYAL